MKGGDDFLSLGPRLGGKCQLLNLAKKKKNTSLKQQQTPPALVRVLPESCGGHPDLEPPGNGKGVPGSKRSQNPGNGKSRALEQGRNRERFCPFCP